MDQRNPGGNMAITYHQKNTFLDKSTWGDGPWQSEPDKVQWTDEATGLACMAVRHPTSGHWCGYVGVAEGSPAFGLGYDEANELAPTDEDDYRAFRVHGGLTFSDFCQEGEEDTGICHIPQPGQPERVWWFGFDCAHWGDLCPMYLARYRYSGHTGTYRSLEYVEQECASLADQLAHPVERS
jgi:hypothetical protein